MVALTLTLGSLFAGIGGLERGLELAGLGPVLWQAECNEDALAVLEHHYPDARRYRDVREVTYESAARVDVLAGGFPCQGLSTANTTRQRLDDPRSGLWREFARIVRELAPRWVVIENVGATWRDWVPVVRADLARDGYASVPLALSTADVGAPHHRDRVFVLAHADSHGQCLRAVDAAISEVRAHPGRAREAVRSACAAAVARDDGLPAGLARLPGNAVAPYVAEVIGRALLTAEAKP